MAETFGAAPEDIPDDAGLGAVAGWDSLGHMRLVLNLEAAIGRTLTPEEVVSLDSLADLQRLLTGKHSPSELA